MKKPRNYKEAAKYIGKECTVKSYQYEKPRRARITGVSCLETTHTATRQMKETDQFSNVWYILDNQPKFYTHDRIEVVNKEKWYQGMPWYFWVSAGVNIIGLIAALTGIIPIN